MTIRTAPSIRLALLIGSLSIVTALVLSSLSPEWLVSWLGIQIFWVGTVLLLILSVVLTWSAARLDYSKIALRLALVLWAFLLISEEIFGRTGTGEVEEHFSSSVYGEISLWILAFGTLLILLIRNPDVLHDISLGQSKWLFAFGAFCVMSATYSPQPLFSAAWGFKLLLVILMLRACSCLIRDEGDLLAFVRATFWACFLLAVYEALGGLSSWYAEGRLAESPDSLAVVAGILLVLSLSLRSLSSAVWPVISSVVASLIMILSGGKAGIIGGILSAVLFFLLKKKVGSAIALLTGLVGFGVLLLLVSTPLRIYADKYVASGQAQSFTGRTGLWLGALPLIQQSPLIGHGYMTSKYVSLEIEDVHWEAGHLHNAFLDVLYNNGFVGLLLILYMHVVIIKSFLYVIKQRGLPRECYEIAVAFLAIYLNLLINAFFNSIIGGRPDSLFMIFLALFVISENLRRSVTWNTGARTESNMRTRLSLTATETSNS